MTAYTVSQWILFFYIYCFCGWVWESAYVSVCERKPVNRGFLKGPFLPIYGSGAICILIVTIPVRGNIPAMCIVGMVSATVLEYITGYVMERLTARTGLRDIDCRKYPLFREPPVEHELHIAGPLKLLIYDVIHLTSGIHKRSRQNRQASALPHVPSR